jgi:hypothetical protein
MGISESRDGHGAFVSSMTPPTDEERRERFEDWARRKHLRTSRVASDRRYLDMQTEHAWLAWQAAIDLFMQPRSSGGPAAATGPPSQLNRRAKAALLLCNRIEQMTKPEGFTDCAALVDEIDVILHAGAGCDERPEAAPGRGR